MEDKTKPLKGQNNKRLKLFQPLNVQSNAAWADCSSGFRLESNVSEPSQESVEEAKDWVDDGSQL